MGTERSRHARRCLAMMLANRAVQVLRYGKIAWLAVPLVPRARAKATAARASCLTGIKAPPVQPALRWNSSWRRHQTPVSLRPLGARSSHWYMPQKLSSPRAYVE